MAPTGSQQNNDNSPPELQLIGFQSVIEGDSLSFAVLAFDPDGTTPVLTAEDLPLNAGFADNGDGTGEFQFRPQYTQAGKYEVRFIASDGVLADTELVTITVEEAGNQPPVVAPIGTQSVDEGQNLHFGVSATDPDGTMPALTAENVPANASFADFGDGTGEFDFDPYYSQSGEYDVRFIASDGSLADTEVVVITVNDVNRAPVLDSIGPKSVDEGQNLAFGISASDPDGTTPTLIAADVPANATFVDNTDGTGVFSFNPDYAQAAVYQIRFTASDGVLSDAETVAITVNNVNRAPQLASIGPQSVDEAQNLNLNVSAVDPDGSMPTLAVEDLPPNAIFSDNGDGTGVLDFTPDYTQAGSYEVRVIASDGQSADSEIVPITVLQVNLPPVLAPIGSQTVSEGQPLNLVVSAGDQDGTTPALTAEDLPANATFTDHHDGTGSFLFAPDYTQAGLYHVRFIASDGALADSEVVTITVEDVNRPPVLTPIGPHSVIEMQTLFFAVSATDPDGVTASLRIDGAPPHAILVDHGDGTGTFTFTPDYSQAGVYGVRFIAADGVLADTELVVITVDDAGNHAPVLVSIGPKTVTEGQPLDFEVSASDVDGTIPVLTAENVPANAVFADNQDGTGAFAFTPNYTQAGSFLIRFMASDGLLADTQMVPVLVEDARPEGANFAIPSAAWSRSIGDVPSGAKSNDPNRGVVLGGFGAGAFMYNLSGSLGPWADEVGEFNPSRLKGAAFHIYEKVGADVRVKCLTTDTVALPAWDKIAVGDGNYFALQPKGWCTYAGFNTEVACQFFSPIIAHNYRETSYPVAIWEFGFSNPTSQPAEVSVMLTWPNPLFNKGKRIRTGLSNTPVVSNGIAAVVLKAAHAANAPETQNSEWCIAARPEEGALVSFGSWNPGGDGSDIWTQFASNGILWYEFDPLDSAAAIAVKVTLPPGGKRVIPLALAWDFPVVEFSGALGGPRSTQWWKRYCEYFDTLSDNSFAIAALALDSCETWSARVDAWMAPFVEDVRYPPWLLRAAFNELYYSQFGGSFWESGLRSGHPEEYMGLHPEDHKNFDMESMVYTLSGNLSVGHYSSIVYAQFWPEMERDLLRSHADIILYHDKCNPSVRYQASPEIGTPVDYLPYDTCSIGDPFFVVDPHAYQSRPAPCAPGTVHVQTETSSKFIQRCWRYYALSHDQELLEYIWPAAESTFVFMKTYDCEPEPKDSLPDAQGYDNTYDGWGMYGTDIYSGGFWVGALEALDTMAAILNKPIRAEVQAWLEAARRNLDEQLWDAENRYYHVDTDSPYPTAVFADALGGQRYCEAYGLPDILPRERINAHLQKVYDICVAPNADHGARLGRMPDGTIVPSGDRDTYEYWVGTTYYVAAMMYRAGLAQEALTTAYGAYWPVYESEETAYWFNTPEAWTDLFNARPGTRVPSPARELPMPPGYASAPALGEAPARMADAQWPGLDPHQYQRPRAVWELILEMQDAPPQVPVLLRPQHLAYLVDSTPTFRWSRSLGPGGSYTLQYARDAAFSLDVWTRQAIADTFYIVPVGESLTGGVWFWRVQAIDKSGKSSGFTDPPYSFTIDTEHPCACDGLGDCNGDQIINPVDVVYMVKHVYKAAEPPPSIPDCPTPNGDWNCDNSVNPVDVVWIVNYVYKAQIPGPCNPCE